MLVADSKTFRNVLVAMRPKTVDRDIPTRKTIRKNIEREFCKVMIELKDAVIVSQFP